MKEEEADPEDDDLSSKQFLRKSEQARWFGVNPRTIKRWAEKYPTFPAEFELSEKMLVRSRLELEAWVQAHKKERKRKPDPAAGGSPAPPPSLRDRGRRNH